MILFINAWSGLFHVLISEKEVSVRLAVDQWVKGRRPAIAGVL